MPHSAVVSHESVMTPQDAAPEAPVPAEPVKPAKKKGRPTVYSEKLGQEICRRLAAGETLRSVCRDEDMPPESTVRGWAIDEKLGFSAQYTRAREVGYYLMADEIIEIADDATNDYVEKVRQSGDKYIAFDSEHVKRSELRIQTRKWLLAKALPKVFGDKVDVEMRGDIVTTTIDRPPNETREEWLARRARELGTDAVASAAVGATARPAK
jgi:hypothetical protein